MMANISRIPPLLLSSSFSENDSLLSFPISSIHSFPLSISLSLCPSLFPNFFCFSIFISVSFHLVLHHLPSLSFYFSLFSSLSLQQTLYLSLSFSLFLSFFLLTLSLFFSLSLFLSLSLSLYSPTPTLSLNHHNGTL